MFEAISGRALTYHPERIMMNSDVNIYDTRGSDKGLYPDPTPRKELYRECFVYISGKLLNGLPEVVQISANTESFKRNFEMYKSLISSWQNRHLCLFGNLWVPAGSNPGVYGLFSTLQLF